MHRFRWTRSPVTQYRSLMRLFVIVPIGLVGAAVVFMVQGTFWVAVTALIIAAPCIVIACLQGAISRWWERRSFAKAIRQQQDGTFVEEWRRHV